MQLPRTLWIAVTVVIVLAWLANLVVGWFYIGRSEPAVNFIFGAVVGSLYMIKPRAAEAAKTMTDALSNAKTPTAEEKPARGEAP